MKSRGSRARMCPALWLEFWKLFARVFPSQFTMKLPNCWLFFEPNAGYHSHLLCSYVFHQFKLWGPVFSRNHVELFHSADLVLAGVLVLCFPSFGARFAERGPFCEPNVVLLIAGAPLSRNSVVGKLILSSWCSGATFFDVRGPSENHGNERK